MAIYAGFWKRVLALVLDTLLFLFARSIFYVFYLALYTENFKINLSEFLFMPQFLSSGTHIFVYLSFSVITSWLYSATFESSILQATIGKKVIGIVVCDDNHKRISFLRATGRHFAKILSSMTLGIGFLLAAFTKDKKALHDLVASTNVINFRTKNSGNFTSSNEFLLPGGNTTFEKFLIFAGFDAHGNVIRLSISQKDSKLFSENGVLIGRDRSKCDFILTQDSISRVHVSIKSIHQKLYITDLSSTNGTYMDGIQILSNQPILLPNNGTIIIGDVEFAIRLD